MIVFCLAQHRALLLGELDERSAPALGQYQAGRFSDGERWVELDGPVAGEECAVLGSLAPPDGQMLATLLLMNLVPVLYSFYGHRTPPEGAGSMAH